MHLLVSEQYIDSIMHGATIKVTYMLLRICLTKLYITKYTVSKRKFFCFCEQSSTLHKDLDIFYWFWRHKFSHINIVVQHTFFLYSWNWHVAQLLWQNPLLCFHRNSGFATLSVLLKLWGRIPPHSTFCQEFRKFTSYFDEHFL